MSADCECIIKNSSLGVVHGDKPSQISSIQIGSPVFNMACYGMDER